MALDQPRFTNQATEAGVFDGFPHQFPPYSAVLFLIPRFLVSVLALFGVLLTAQTSNPTPTLADKSLPDTLQDAAMKVLQGCDTNLWPPRVVPSKKPKDRLKTATDSGFEDMTAKFTSQLLRDLSITLPKDKPSFYDASFLRLFDSVGTFAPNIANSNLLGIALSVPAEDLGLWGTTSFVFKHNCSSLLGISGKFGAQYALPVFALDAALKASQDSQSDRVFVLSYGSFQNPFEVFYTSGRKPDRLFGALRALRWRQAFQQPSSEQILVSAEFLTLHSQIGASDTSDVFGSLKLGLTLPFISASGELNTKVARSFQLTGQSFKTHFWNGKYSSLRASAELISTVEGALPEFGVTPEAVSETDEIRASSDIAGWPQDMCDGNWKATILSTNFAGAKAVVSTVSPPGIKPHEHVCRIEVFFTLAKPAPGKGVALGDPKLQLERLDGKDSQGADKVIFSPIGLRLAKTIRQVGQPDPNPDTVISLWEDKGDKAVWTVAGRLRVESERRILSKSIDRGTLSCGGGEKGALVLSDLSFDDDSPEQDGDIAAWKTKLSLLWSAANFNKNPRDYASGSRKTCIPSFTMTVVTDNGSGGARQTANLAVKSPAAINYPDELPAKPAKPKKPELEATASIITVKWTEQTGAKHYRVARVVDGEVTTKKVIKDNYILTSLTDKDVEVGRQYTYYVTAINAGGDSEESDGVTGSPSPAPPVSAPQPTPSR